MNPSPHDRGFSLLVVLMAVLLLAVAGTAAMALSGTEAGVSKARARRQQALDAAEAGLRSTMLVAAPRDFSGGQVNIAGSLGGEAEVNFVYLPPIDSDVDGAIDTELRYRSWSTAGDVGGVFGAGQAIVEGQVVENGEPATSVRLQVVMRTVPTQTQYSSQIGGGSSGSGSFGPGASGAGRAIGPWGG